MFRLIIIFFSILSLGFVQFISPANAEYPDKPVKLIVNFSAGGTTDIAARLMVSKATEILKQAIICMNKPGAGGTLGVSYVARAKNDGYTIGTWGVNRCRKRWRRGWTCRRWPSFPRFAKSHTNPSKI